LPFSFSHDKKPLIPTAIKPENSGLLYKFTQMSGTDNSCRD